MTERYINPFTDFGFKKIFGEEANKDLLIDFLKLFEVAEIATYNPQEQIAYQDSVKSYRDWKNVMDTVFEKGTEEGGKVREREIARQMKLAGEPTDKISTFTGLPTDEIDRL